MTTGFMNKGSTWMNNGQIEALVREDQINSFIQKGYTMGRLQAKILTTEATPQVGVGKNLLQEG